MKILNLRRVGQREGWTALDEHGRATALCCCGLTAYLTATRQKSMTSSTENKSPSSATRALEFRSRVAGSRAPSTDLAIPQNQIRSAHVGWRFFSTAGGRTRRRRSAARARRDSRAPRSACRHRRRTGQRQRPSKRPPAARESLSSVRFLRPSGGRGRPPPGPLWLQLADGRMDVFTRSSGADAQPPTRRHGRASTEVGAAGEGPCSVQSAWRNPRPWPASSISFPTASPPAAGRPASPARRTKSSSPADP